MRLSLVLLTVTLALPALALDPIQTVALGANREFVLNGKPFFPVMFWLQDPANFPRAQEIGANTIAGYWPKSGGTADVAEYLKLVEAAGLYGVMPHDPRLHGHPWLLGYIHDDEPDLTHRESDAAVEAGAMLRVNNSTPLWKLVDGETSSWSVVDPLVGGSFTIKLAAPVTIERLGVWLTVSPGLPVAKRITFVADGKELIAADLQNARGRQEVKLAAPATFSQLTVCVDEAYPGQQVWGSLGEIEGFDAAGKNVLLAPPRDVVRQEPDQTLRAYQDLRAADPGRPVFMTLTANFMPFFKKLPEDRRQQLYGGYVKAADALGFDIYPIYGWGRLDWVHLVSEGMADLRALAPGKPLYAWIETSRGGQYTGDLAAQKVVTPAHIRAEVWMSICQGATAIGYFTHVWKPAYSQFGVPPENVAALKEINAQLQRLTPALAGPVSARTVKFELEGGLRADVLAKDAEGALYIFAVNSDSAAKAARGTFTVPGLTAGQAIEVVDEKRTLTAEAGVFHDDFAPLAVHIYRLK